MAKHKQSIIIYLIDLVILTGSFLLVALYKPATARYLADDYLIAFIALLLIWSLSSFYFRKYSFRKKHTAGKLFRKVLLSNFFSLGLVLVSFVMFWVSGYSRLMLFGTIGLATTIELIAGSMYYSLIKTKTNGHTRYNPPPKIWELKSARKAPDYKKFTLSSDVIKRTVEEELGPGMYNFMNKELDGNCKQTLILSTGSRFNVEMQPDNFYKAVVNMKRVNDIRYINKFFESVNRKLPIGGTYIGCAETKQQRKKRILAKYPPVLNWIFYTFDFIVKRVFPKFFLTHKIYFFLTRGNNRVLSRAELMGRLYSCGFRISGEEFINGMYCFCVRKVGDPSYDFDPTYGPFIKLRRIGKNGDIIRVYKFRTMHPYAEYLQDYIFEMNNLDNGGKYKNDFRVTTMGKVMRTLWIDELPMFFNLLKGEVKLVGVRPLSQQYFNLYSDELQMRRVKYNPGLVPPFYADMPSTLAEIQESESRYLDSYEKNPFLTDINYLLKAAVNIVYKRARSK